MWNLEAVYHTDCVQRNKEFDYLAHFDPDELPILKQHKTIQDFILDVERY